jgi:8-oxo-dGTP pyrophosphatase MutT (NUDIX family)
MAGEEPASAIAREIFEETSLRVVPRRISGVYTTPIISYPNGDRA